jgi:predicted Zn-dependent protease
MRDSSSPDLKRLWMEVSLLIDDERYQEAEERLRQVLLDRPENVDVMTRLGEVLAYQHKEREAEKVLKHVLSKQPTHETAVSLLGRLLDNSLRVEEAEDLLRDALEKSPSSHCVKEDLCRLLYDEGRVEEAFQLAREHVDRYSESPQAYNPLRYLLVRREENLEDELVESDCAPESYIEIAKNAVMQYDLLTSLESALASQEPSEANDEVAKDVLADIFRVIGDIEDTREQMAIRKGRMPPELQRRIKKIVAEGKARRELL